MIWYEEYDISKIPVFTQDSLEAFWSCGAQLPPLIPSWAAIKIYQQSHENDKYEVCQNYTEAYQPRIGVVL